MDAISLSSSRHQQTEAKLHADMLDFRFLCGQSSCVFFPMPRVKVHFAPKVWLQRKSMPYHGMLSGLSHGKRVLGCWIVQAKVHTSQASEALKTLDLKKQAPVGWLQSLTMPSSIENRISSSWAVPRFLDAWEKHGSVHVTCRWCLLFFWHGCENKLKV